MAEEHDEATSTETVQRALQRAVDNALERKRRLGEYAVIWRDGKPVRVGIDIPWVELIASRPEQR